MASMYNDDAAVNEWINFTPCMKLHALHEVSYVHKQRLKYLKTVAMHTQDTHEALLH